MLRHTHILSLAATLALVAGVVTGEPPRTDADEAIAALLKEHEASDLGYVKAYQAFLPRFVQFAEAHRGTEAEARAVLWQIQQCWWLRQEGTMEETALPLADDLIERHAKSPQLALLAEYQYVFKKKQRRALFDEMLAVSPHDGVKAAAHFGLAKLGEARTPDGEANTHYQALATKYADVRWRHSTYGAIADAFLNPHAASALAVGSAAPEIEGVDHLGKPMKLSDYRGKVVLLDFWGHW